MVPRSSCLLFPKLINPQLRLLSLSEVLRCLLFPKLINPQQLGGVGVVGAGCLLFPKLINPQPISLKARLQVASEPAQRK